MCCNCLVSWGLLGALVGAVVSNVGVVRRKGVLPWWPTSEKQSLRLDL